MAGVRRFYLLLGRLLHWPLSRLDRLGWLPGRHRVWLILIARTHPGRVLLVQNWLGDGGYQPVGGGRKAAESCRSAAVRELSEEVNLTLQPRQLQPVGSYSVRRNHQITVYSYYCQRQPELDFNRREIAAGGWFEAAQIRQLPLTRDCRQLLGLILDLLEPAAAGQL